MKNIQFSNQPILCAVAMTGAWLTGMTHSTAAVTAIFGVDNSNPPGLPLSSLDLLQTSAAAPTGTSLFGDIATLSDGSWGVWQDATNTSAGMSPGDSVQWDLDTSINTLGYDLAAIETSAWWSTGGGGRSEHNYSVLISYVGDPNFVELAPATHYTPGNLASVTQVTLIDLQNGSTVPTGVDAIRFEFSAAPEGAAGQQFFREIDVFGTPTVIPEPGSVLLLCMGSGALLLRRRRLS